MAFVGNVPRYVLTHSGELSRTAAQWLSSAFFVDVIFLMICGMYSLRIIVLVTTLYSSNSDWNDSSIFLSWSLEKSASSISDISVMSAPLERSVMVFFDSIICRK